MIRIIKTAVSVLCVAVAALVVLGILLPAVLGLQRYVITGGSMTGTIDKGSVVYARLTPVGQLKVGDIITFVPPGYPSPDTHRIISITPGKGGQRVFRTKGDFNKIADPWQITFPQPMQARYFYHIPYVGYLLALLLVLALLAHTWWRWSEKKKKKRRPLVNCAQPVHPHPALRATLVCCLRGVFPR